MAFAVRIKNEEDPFICERVNHSFCPRIGGDLVDLAFVRYDRQFISTELRPDTSLVNLKPRLNNIGFSVIPDEIDSIEKVEESQITSLDLMGRHLIRNRDAVPLSDLREGETYQITPIGAPAGDLPLREVVFLESMARSGLRLLVRSQDTGVQFTVVPEHFIWERTTND